MVFAEESTAWPMISQSTVRGGLGFTFKWDMGWMNDTLFYMSADYNRRAETHDKLTFRSIYLFNENFALCLSHDEVTLGKKSLIEKMPGNEEEKFANLRLLYAYMFLQPGKKLMFMGNEFGQRSEWNSAGELDWQCISFPYNKGLQNFVRDLNHFYSSEPSLFETDCVCEGFRWLDCSRACNGLLAFIRWAFSINRCVICVFNFSTLAFSEYRIGVPIESRYLELLNSDSIYYGGRNRGNSAVVQAEPFLAMNSIYSISLYVPPLTAIVLGPERDAL